MNDGLSFGFGRGLLVAGERELPTRVAYYVSVVFGISYCVFRFRVQCLENVVEREGSLRAHCFLAFAYDTGFLFLFGTDLACLFCATFYFGTDLFTEHLAFFFELFACGSFFRFGRFELTFPFLDFDFGTHSADFFLFFQSLKTLLFFGEFLFGCFPSCFESFVLRLFFRFELRLFHGEFFFRGGFFGLDAFDFRLVLGFYTLDFKPAFLGDSFQFGLFFFFELFGLGTTFFGDSLRLRTVFFGGAFGFQSALFGKSLRFGEIFFRRGPLFFEQTQLLLFFRGQAFKLLFHGFLFGGGLCHGFLKLCGLLCKARRFFFGDFVAVGVKENFFLNQNDFFDFLFLIDDFGLVGGLFFGVRTQFLRIERCGIFVEVELLGGNQPVENRTRIFVFRLFLLQEVSAFGGEGIVSASAAAGIVGVSVVGRNQPLFFQPFELVVKGRLFEFVLTFALGLNLFQNVVAVTVLAPKGTKNNRCYVASDEVAVDGRNIHKPISLFDTEIITNYYIKVNIS